jgi:hypothetical protein
MANVGHKPGGHQPGGHVPSGHEPVSTTTSSSLQTGAKNPGSAASTLYRYASTFQVDNITNSGAEVDAGNRYNMCMRTGFRAKPHTLVEDAYGALVRPDSYDKRHPQELIRPLAEEITGPKRPEPTDLFLSASVAPSDL